MDNLNTREQWLQAATEKFREDFKNQGYPLPENIRVSCGFPSKSALTAKRQRVGECWSDSASGDKHFEIFVSPVEDRPVRILDILAHELVHTAVGTAAKHGTAFKRCAVAIGLTGKMTATVAGDELKERLHALAVELGEYPHAKITPTMTNGRKTQGTRMLKLTCGSCGYAVRTTQKWLDRGKPTCCCSGEMFLDGPDVDPESEGE